jgi:hypothetical protein
MNGSVKFSESSVNTGLSHSRRPRILARIRPRRQRVLHGIISIGRGAIPTGVSLSLLALDAILVTAPGAVLESMARGLLFVGAGAPDCLHLAGCPVRRRASASGAAIRALRRHPQSSVGRLSRASRAAVASRVSQATG